MVVPGHGAHRFGHTRITLIVLCLVASAGTTRAQSADVTIFAPMRQDYVLALDEIEVEATDRSRVLRSEDVGVPPGASIADLNDRRALLQATSVTSRDALVQVARGVEARSPGTRVNFVLYEAGRARTAATRRVLTREVSVVVERGADARALIAAVTSAEPRALDGLPRAFIIEASEPLDAVDVAASLRALAGVRAAYPLLRGTQALR